MHVNITKSETGNNKGSSSPLVAYLEKENRLTDQLNNQPEYWFNSERNNIQPYEVRQGIDGNKDLVYYGKLEHHRYYTLQRFGSTKRTSKAR